MITTVLYLVAGTLFAVSAGAALWRIVRGPTILDRMLASDVLLTIVLLVLGFEMVVNEHTRTLPIMIVLAGTAALSTVAVARYVSQQDRATVDAAPLSGGPGEESRDG
jgi:multicomponent Na+:H+ antiporter subunit F